MTDQLKALLKEMEERKEKYLIDSPLNEYLQGLNDGKFTESLFIIKKLKLILKQEGE